MQITAIDRPGNRAMNRPGKVQPVTVGQVKDYSPLDRVELSARGSRLEGLYVGISLISNIPMSTVIRRDGFGISYAAKNEKQDMREVFEARSKDLKENGPKSEAAKSLLNDILGYFIETGGRKPLTLSFEKITYRENNAKGKILQSSKYGSGMTFDLWRVTLPDGTQGLDYVSRGDREARLIGIGKLEARFPTSVNGKKFRY